MVQRIVERVEITADSPSREHAVHEYEDEKLREVHESPYRIIYSSTESEFLVITIVHFKQTLNPSRLTRR